MRRPRFRRLLIIVLTLTVLPSLVITGVSPQRMASARADVTPTPTEESSPSADASTPEPGTLLDATRTTNTYVGENGTLEAVEYPGSINYKDASGLRRRHRLRDPGRAVTSTASGERIRQLPTAVSTSPKPRASGGYPTDIERACVPRTIRLRNPAAIDCAVAV
jgi:hypothetical protein